MIDGAAALAERRGVPQARGHQSRSWLAPDTPARDAGRRMHSRQNQGGPEIGGHGKNRQLWKRFMPLSDCFPGVAANY